MIVSPEERQQALDEIVSEIQSESNECKWYITSERIAELIDIPREELQRKIYSKRADFRYRSGIHGGFNETDGDVLCLVLENILATGSVARKFMESGIYFSETDLERLRIFFRLKLATFLEKHELDLELLMLLASSTMDFDDAFDSYMDEKLEPGLFAKRVVDLFIEENAIDTTFGADRYLGKYLETAIEKKRINLQKITAEYRDRAYYSLYGRLRNQQKPRKKRRPQTRFEYLLQFFRLEAECSVDEARRRYKEMLKEHHPDLNKDGLEMTQKITANFKELIKYIK